MADTIIITDENGQEIQDVTVLSVTAEHEFNKVPKAEIKLTEGDTASQKYENLDSDHFKIGKKIGISIREEGYPKTEIKIFKGIVVNLNLEISDASSEGHTLLIDLSDEAIKMTNGRFSDVYTDKTDAKIIEKLITANALKHGPIKGMEVMHQQMIRNLVTDWDFMVLRAEANGQLVNVKDSNIFLIPPEIQEIAHHTIDFGIEPCHVYDVQLQANGSDQYGKVEAVVWDPSKLKMAKPVEGKYELEQDEDYPVAEIAEAVGAEVTPLVQATPMTKEEAEAWSNAQVMKSRLSLLTGSFKIAGRTGKYEVGQTISIKGLGDRNSGENIITGVRHECSNSSGWTTEVQVGMDADWFSSQTGIADVPAAGLLPGVHGLQLGVVADQKEEDPEFRVKVRMPVFGIGKDKAEDKAEVKENTVWARLASIYAGNGHGVLFRPEKDDEVVVGFLNDDPRQAIILGAMHSKKKNKTPVPVTKENKQKGIFTKSGYQLLFDEENEIVTLATSDKNKICIDEKQGIMSLADTHGNQVEMNSEGILIKTNGNLKFEADGNVEIKGKKVDLI